MSDHPRDETAPAWLRGRFPGWTFRRGISGRWFAWNPGKTGRDAPDLMGYGPHDLGRQIVRAEARSGT